MKAQPVADMVRATLEDAFAAGHDPESILAGLTSVYGGFLAMFYGPEELPEFYEREAQSARDDLTRPRDVSRPFLSIVAGTTDGG